jgi:radical SAM protein with 4Fe4S-binding SPASM domain
MSDTYLVEMRLPEMALWGNTAEKRVPFSFDIELTARCNNDCRHCFINLPAGDRPAQEKELTRGEIADIARQAVALGSLWCLITGGEPLLRPDFAPIYVDLKRLGLLVSVFTNACPVTPEHVALLRRYPPRDVEVSVYGVTRETYEAVTRRPGSYAAFRRGLDLLLDGGIKVRLKAMALRSNVHELPQIAAFCREHTRDYFRFDPLLHLRYDGDPARNAEIRAERLSPAQIAEIEQADPERSASLANHCADLIQPEAAHTHCNHLFHCGAGSNSFSVGYDGTFRLCSDLVAAGCTYDLRAGTLAEAWHEWVPHVRNLRSDRPEFLEGCRACPLVNLCLWCPARGYIETGSLDGRTDYFCEVAEARAAAIQQAAPPSTSFSPGQ